MCIETIEVLEHASEFKQAVSSISMQNHYKWEKNKRRIKSEPEGLIEEHSEDASKKMENELKEDSDESLNYVNLAHRIAFIPKYDAEQNQFSTK